MASVESARTAAVSSKKDRVSRSESLPTHDGNTPRERSHRPASRSKSGSISRQRTAEQHTEGKPHSPPSSRRSSRSKSTRSDYPEDEQENVLVEGCLRLLRRIPVGDSAMVSTFDEDGITLAVGCFNGLVKIYDVVSNEVVFTIGRKELGFKPVMGLSFLPKLAKGRYRSPSPLAVAHSDGVVRFWDVRDNRQILKFQDSDRGTNAMDFDSKCTCMATVGGDSRVCLYDLERECPVTSLDRLDGTQGVNQEAMPVYSVKFNPKDDNLLITGGWDTCLYFWDKRMPYTIRHVYGPHVTGNSLSFKKSGEQFMAGSWSRDKSLQEYDFDSASLIATYGGRDADLYSQVYSCHYMGYEERIVAAGGSNYHMLRLIDTESAETVARVRNLPRGVFDICSKPAINVANGALFGQYQSTDSETFTATDSATNLESERPGHSKPKYRGHLAMCCGEEIFLLQHGIK